MNGKIGSLHTYRAPILSIVGVRVCKNGAGSSVGQNDF
jgi:hypothetical protein